MNDFTMFIMAPVMNERNEILSLAHVAYFETATDASLTNGNVGPVDTFLTWFFRDGHC